MSLMLIICLFLDCCYWMQTIKNMTFLISLIIRFKREIKRFSQFHKEKCQRENAPFTRKLIFMKKLF